VNLWAVHLQVVQDFLFVTQVQVASRLGKARSFVSKCELGERRVDSSSFSSWRSCIRKICRSSPINKASASKLPHNFRINKWGVDMSDASDQRLLEALLDSWDRNNTILLNLLRVLPEGGLEARAMEGSPSIAGLFTHIHFVRLVFVFEDAPEFARDLPAEEWVVERDAGRIAQMLNESAKAVRDAVKSRVEAGQDMNLHYDHPVLLLQHMIWHEGYHHGQMKLALKVASRAMTDEEVGPVTWDVWMRKSKLS
jgi:uncharacterized damage-inducible protein DinB